MFILFAGSCETTKKSVNEFAINTVNESDIKMSFQGNPIGTTTRISVYFTGGFNDSLIVKQNNVIIHEGFFKSDWSTSYTGVVIIVDLNNGNKLEIVEVHTGKSKLINLFKGYKIIDLSKYSNEWAALYTNIPTVFE